MPNNLMNCSRDKIKGNKDFRKQLNTFPIMIKIIHLINIFNTNIHRMVLVEILTNKVRSLHFFFIQILIIHKIKIYQTQKK